jgi:hypothetical protein
MGDWALSVMSGWGDAHYAPGVQTSIVQTSIVLTPADLLLHLSLHRALGDAFAHRRRR